MSPTLLTLASNNTDGESPLSLSAA